MPKQRRRSRRPRVRASWGFVLFLAALVLVVYAIHRSGKGPFVLDRLRTAAERAKESLPTPAGPATGGAVTVHFAPTPRDTAGGIDDALLAFIGGAKESLLCAIYDLEWDGAAEALVARHQAGVAVRMVSDSEYAKRDGIKACIAAGIPVIFDERGAFMHNKFIVADGALVWTGSTNVTTNGLFLNNNNAVRIESPDLAANYTAEFEEMFGRRFGPRSPRATPHAVIVVSGITMENYFAPEDDVEKEVLSEIAAARQTLAFMAFSFTSEPIAKAMAAGMKRGVQVRGVFENRNAGSQYSRDEWIADRGATVYMDSNPYTMHHKVMVIDGQTVITGSYNFSKAAERENDENVLIIHDPAIAEAYSDEFERLIR